ncbi:hypothetical protein [Roseovarius ramblicola]|uniref:NADH dehydrogenase subunit E n=1 Tax=Roseovarius ramblicola TaxID=2022336 RepID=A0ABV5I3I6_9RHOB
MLRPAIPLCALGALAACAALPPGTTEADLARFDAAADSLGCTLRDEGDYLAMEIQTGLARQQLLELAAYRLTTGGAERLPDGGVKLTTGACA